MSPLILTMSFVVALATTLALTPAVARWAAARGAFCPADPGGRRVHRSPIPRLGGVAVAGGVAAALAAAALVALIAGISLTPNWPAVLAFLGISGIVLVAGAWDDHREIGPAAKFGAQLVAAVLVFALGFRIETITLPWASGVELGMLALPLTVFWIVGITNAFNLIDGLDGLASGIALVALLATAGVALGLGNAEVALIALALSGALLGFLRYNFNPARIFLGDSGSLFVGFMLAVLAVHGSMKSTTGVIAVVPLLLLAVPLLDTGVAMARRWLRGMSMSAADGRHIHHQLLRLGFTQRRAVAVLYATAASLAMAGVAVAFSPPDLALLMSLTAAVGCLVLVAVGMRGLGYHEFAEAGLAAVSGLRKARRVIRDRIHARDLVPILELAETPVHMNAIMADNAEHFGFVHMEVCRESARRGRRQGNSRLAGAYTLDFPLHVDEVSYDPFVLRIWCGPAGAGSRPQGSERVASVLAPVLASRIEQWIIDEHMALRVLPHVSNEYRQHALAS